jgi:hypothetical protein
MNTSCYEIGMRVMTNNMAEFTAGDGSSTLPTGKVGDCLMLEFFIKRGGQDVTDLGPYLDAPAHLFVVSSDLLISKHYHAMIGGDSMSQMNMDCDSHMGDHGTPPAQFASPVRDHWGILIGSGSALTPQQCEFFAPACSSGSTRVWRTLKTLKASETLL